MKFIKKHIKLITIVIVLILIVSLGILKYYLNNNQNKDIEEEIIKEEIVKEDILASDEKMEEEIIENVYVDIKGAIKNPGVYEIENNKKVIDVVNKAGGLANNADTSMINLAKNVVNEMVIIIYTKEEVKKYQQQEEIIKVIDKECICPEVKNDACINNQNQNKLENNTSTSTKEEDKNKKININTATLEELQSLTGIGEGKAEAIIKYRSEIGNFKNIEEIKNVSGIGESVYEKIKNNITI